VFIVLQKMLQILLEQQTDVWANSNVLTITIVVGALVAIVILYLSFSSSDSKQKSNEKPVEEQPVVKPKEGYSFAVLYNDS
jgi:flagellar basal body-associated protein FliL